MKLVMVFLTSLLLSGCTGQEIVNLDEVKKTTPIWDEFNMQTTVTAISKGHYRYAVRVFLANSSGRLYGVNIPVEYDPDLVYFDEFVPGPFNDCQENMRQPVLMLHDPDPCTNVVSVGTAIWQPAGGCLPYCRIRCDNEMFTLYFVTVDESVGNKAKFKFACGEGDCSFRARNCANGSEYFRLYIDGMEQQHYVENCEHVDSHRILCEYDSAYTLAEWR